MKMVARIPAFVLPLNLYTACIYGGKSSQNRPCFVAGQCLSRNSQHFAVPQGGLQVDSLASNFYMML